MKKIAIIGSCVSRDAFEFDKSKFDISAAYFPRASIVSLMSKPIEIDHTVLSDENQWLKWVILNDYNKSTITQVKAKKPDAIIVDLIEERFDLININGNFLTRSDDLLKVYPLIKEVNAANIVSRNSNDDILLFSSHASLFCETLNRELPDVKVIIHDARYSDYYMDNGKIIKFDEHKCYGNKQANARLEMYSKILIKELKNVAYIKLDNEISIANKNHKWGLSPFHYTDEYYEEFMARISYLLN